MSGSQVASCSPVYIRMRNAVVARPQRAGAASAASDVPLSELQRRLQMLSSSIARGGNPTGSSLPGQGMPSSAALANLATPAPLSGAGGAAAAAADANAAGAGGGGTDAMRQQYMEQAEAEDESLRVRDLLPVRVIELEEGVQLRASSDAAMAADSGRAPSMDLVCTDARVKIFAKHVVAARADSGAPVAELVLEELFQLSEDADTNSLTFFLGPRPTADGKSVAASTIVEFRCQSLAQLRTLYKMISLRRSGVELLKHEGL